MIPNELERSFDCCDNTGAGTDFLEFLDRLELELTDFALLGLDFNFEVEALHTSDKIENSRCLKRAPMNFSPSAPNLFLEFVAYATLES